MKKKYPASYRGKYKELTGSEIKLVNEIDDMFKALNSTCPGFDRETEYERPFYEYYQKNSHYPYMPMYRTMLWEYKRMNSPIELNEEQKTQIELIAFNFMKEHKLIG